MDKWLVDFPRPANDTGRGVHWSPSQYMWGREQWSFWYNLLKGMNIKWVKVLDDGSGSSMGLIKRLINLGIMPVIRIYKQEPNPGIVNAGELNFMRECVKMGVFYFETNNEPDLDLEWKDKRRPENWLDIIVDNFITEASYIRDFGGYLLFPAFGPGGRGNPFQMIVDKGHGDLLDGNMCLAIHNYCLARPLTYPNDQINMYGAPLSREQWESAGGVMGPMWAWEMGEDRVNWHRRASMRPNADIMSDSTCFRAYEYFDQLVNDACGHSIPIFTTEGGYNVGQRAGTTLGDDPRYPKLTPEETSQANLDMFKSIENGPDYYFACMPWIIGVAAFGHGAINFETQGPWITNLFDFDWELSGELPIVKMLKEYQGKLKINSTAPIEWARYNNPLYSERGFDNRLQYLEPEITFTMVGNDEMDWYWRLDEAVWQDENASGNIFIRTIDEYSRIIEGHPVYVMHGDQVETIITKGPVDNGFGDLPMTGGLGSYSVSIPGISDMIHGLGLGDEDGHWKRTSFFLTFRKVKKLNVDFEKYKQQFMDGESDFAAGYDVVVDQVPDGDDRFKVIGICHLPQEENDFKHHIYFEVIDEVGMPIPEVCMHWSWTGQRDNEPSPPVCTGDKGEVQNLAMWGNQIIAARIGIAEQSDTVRNLHTNHPDEPPGNRIGHHSFYIVWQFVRAEVPDGPEQPGEPSTTGDCEEVESELGRVQQELAELKSRVAGLCEDTGE